MTMERRALAAPLEVRSGDNGRTIAGYAVVFNSVTNIGGYFREQFAPGAFANALKGDVRALFDHDTGLVLGRTTSGTLRLREDAKGLAVEIDLPDTSTARDLTASMDRGDIDGMSFGFRATKQEWDETQDPPLRTVREAELIEVSVVTFPQYEDTEIALRDRDAAKDAEQERERVAKLEREAKRACIAARKAKQEQKFRRIGD